MKRGFTLIELLIVIAIVAILTALIIPTCTGKKESTNRNAPQRNTSRATCDLVCEADKYKCSLEQLEAVKIQTDLCENASRTSLTKQYCYEKAKIDHCSKERR